jgi:hypothetical protein
MTMIVTATVTQRSVQSFDANCINPDSEKDFRPASGLGHCHGSFQAEAVFQRLLLSQTVKENRTSVKASRLA